jgi:uncharacterized membrane protein YhaH (DUF805 family)
MNFTAAIQSGFQNYFGFSGRAPRSAYWYWVLFVVLVQIATNIVDAIAFPDFLDGTQNGPITVLVSLALLIPGLAVSVRRLHDIDRSGWWLLIAFVPLVGWVLIIVWQCTKGTAGANRFGPDPFGQHVAETFA